MLLTVTREASAVRFKEAQTYLSGIKLLESIGGSTQATELNVQKGLFIVLLYAAFEYSITRLIVEVAATINSRKVCCEHINSSLYSLALDPELTAAAKVGQRKKWEKRIELFAKQISNTRNHNA